MAAGAVPHSGGLFYERSQADRGQSGLRGYRHHPGPRYGAGAEKGGTYEFCRAQNFSKALSAAGSVYRQKGQTHPCSSFQREIGLQTIEATPTPTWKNLE